MNPHFNISETLKQNLLISTQISGRLSIHRMHPLQCCYLSIESLPYLTVSFNSMSNVLPCEYQTTYLIVRYVCLQITHKNMPYTHKQSPSDCQNSYIHALPFMNIQTTNGVMPQTTSYVIHCVMKGGIQHISSDVYKHLQMKTRQTKLLPTLLTEKDGVYSGLST